MFRRLMCVKSVVLIVGFLVVLAHSLPVYAEWELQKTGVTEYLTHIYFIDENIGWAVGYNSTIIRTEDGGETWEQLDYPEKGLVFRYVEFLNQEVGYCISDFKVLLSQDGGLSWFDRTPDLGRNGCKSMSVIDKNTIWVTTWDQANGRIYHTNDGGLSWDIQHTMNLVPYAIDFSDKDNGWALGAAPDNLSTTLLFRTTDGGREWKAMNVVSDVRQMKLTALNKDVLWAYASLLYVSTDAGLHWSNRLLSDVVRDVYPIDDQRLFLLKSHSLQYSGDRGQTRETIGNSDSTSTFISIAGVDGKYVWCLEFGGRIYKYTADDTAVEMKNTHPVKDVLISNSPNPFNPSTTISFTLPVDADTRLTVYDITGSKIETLIDSNMSAGKHSAVFDGSNLASGVYFYRLENRGFAKSGKMLLIK